MKNRFLSALLLVAALLSSCHEGEVYYRFHPITNGSWSKETSLDFRLDSLRVSPGRRYDISLEIVNSSQYPYQNLWLLVQQNVTDTLSTTDSIEIKLADAHGKWQGSGSAGLYQLSIPYKTGIALDSARAYLIRIRHGMKNDALKGVEKVGVKVKGVE